MMAKLLTILAIIALSYTYISEVCAQGVEDPFSYNRDLKSDEIYDSNRYMTGDWGGFRSKLYEMGIRPTAIYYLSVLGNPVGGETKGVQYAGLLNAYLDFDLEKLIGIKRTKFIVSGSWASGRSLSEENIGNFFTVSQVFSGRSVRLYQMFLETELIEDAIRVAVGRMGVGDEFSTSEIFYNYVNTAINGHPISLPINDEGFFSDPQTSWAARAELKYKDTIYLKAGVYNSNPKVGRDKAYGVDFSFRKGVILIAEIGYLHNQFKTSDGGDGKYSFGGFYDTREFEDLSDDTKKQDGNYSFYWILEQMVYRESNTDDQGLSPWTSITISPDEDINTFPFFINGGLLYKGLIDGRDHDKAAFGFAYGKISDQLKDKDYELMLELTYLIKFKEWLEVQPDVQWVVHPGGSSEIPNALVIGVQMVLDI
ncbi:MAG: carbohydrate porin [Thermodesulfobacteriota bacterium]